MLRFCHRINTSMSRSQASSGAMPRTATASPLPERRYEFGSDALGLKREPDFVFQVVVPSHGLLFRPICVRDGFVVNSVLSDRVFVGLFHGFAFRIRRTEVRPIRSRRAISALRTPAWYTWSAAVAGR